MAKASQAHLTPARCVIALLAIFGAAFLLLPVLALLFSATSTSQLAVADPLLRSLWVAASATLIALALGLPLGWWLARSRAKWRFVVRALVVLPLVLPPVVSGVALLGAFGRQGLLGLDWAFSSLALVLAAAFVALPFFVLAADAAFRSADKRLEEVALTLGASRWRVFRKVVLPQARAMLLVGLVLTFARALGEFGATVTFAGNYSSRRTLPLEIYHQLAARGDFAASIALAQVLLVVALLIVISLSALNRRAKNPVGAA